MSRCGKWWSEEELQTIREHAHLPISKLLKKLPGRSAEAIHQKRARLGIGPGHDGAFKAVRRRGKLKSIRSRELNLGRAVTIRRFSWESEA